MSKPRDINEKTWRRLQITKFVESNSDCKPKDVLTWISSHDPHPWPLCDSNRIGTIMRNIRKSDKPRKKVLSIGHNIISFNFDPLMLKWNMKKPPDVHVNRWRRIQLTRYLDMFPTHKPKDILKWINKQSPNPWPDCSTHKLSW